jgi:penicillin-binding protein 1A
MLALNRPVAGKTGTTNDLRDAWFIGYTPDLVCGVWVGQDDNKPLGRRETGARAAGPIWLRFMQKALADKPARDFQAPPGVVFIRINPDDGKPVPPGREGGFFAAYKAGAEPLPADRDGQPPAQAGASDFMQAETFAPDDSGE